MKQLLILGLIVGSLDLNGECTDVQKKALGGYNGHVHFLSAKKESGSYTQTAEKLQEKAKALAHAFPGKNIVEIKKECDEGYKARDLSDEIIDFITTAVYPQEIKDSFSSGIADNDARIKAANSLLRTMFDQKLFTLENGAMFIDIAERLLVRESVNQAEYSALLATIWDAVGEVTLESRNRPRVFENILVPLFTSHAHKWIMYSPDNHYEKLAGIFFGLSESHKTEKDSDGKTLLHHLFAQDLRNAFVVGEYDIPINWGSSYRELLRLPPLLDFTDQQVSRHFGRNTRIAPLIIKLAQKIGAQKDNEGDTILHALRKNNKDVSKDVDMRALIEYWLEKPDHEGGANLLSLGNERDKSGKRYFDYSPYIAKRDREAFLDRYAAHALSLFGKSLNALAL